MAKTSQSKIDSHEGSKTQREDLISHYSIQNFLQFNMLMEKAKMLPAKAPATDQAMSKRSKDREGIQT